MSWTAATRWVWVPEPCIVPVASPLLTQEASQEASERGRHGAALAARLDVPRHVLSGTVLALM